MTYRYTVGGIAFIADEPLDGLSTVGFSDIELHVRFADERFGEPTDTPDVIHLTGPMETTGAIAPDTLKCWLPASTDNPRERAWQLRQMAPIFSTMLKRLVLHASAVEISGDVIGFLGESGSGKSTLAAFLAERGHRLVADDLLPVRFVPVPASPAGDQMTPLAALFVIARANSDIVDVRALNVRAALQQLITNGFGEHSNESARAFQFDAYHRLANTVPMAELLMPNDLTALPAALAAIEAQVSTPGAAETAGSAP